MQLFVLIYYLLTHLFTCVFIYSYYLLVAYLSMHALIIHLCTNSLILLHIYSIVHLCMNSSGNLLICQCTYIYLFIYRLFCTSAKQSLNLKQHSRLRVRWY